MPLSLPSSISSFDPFGSGRCRFTRRAVTYRCRLLVCPISEFYVGAIVRGISGRLYLGANMEFTGAQLGQTVHAEQCAISHAWMKGEKGWQTSPSTLALVAIAASL